MSDHTITILLVEDNVVDAEAIERGLRKAKIANPIRHVSDGIEALNVLRGEKDERPLPRPYMILLDLQLPRMNGLEFIEALRSDSELRDSVVFVLTTSDAEQDKIAAYGFNVAGYMVKSKAGEDFLDLMEMLDHYWRLVEFPQKRNRAGRRNV